MLALRRLVPAVGIGMDASGSGFAAGPVARSAASAFERGDIELLHSISTELIGEQDSHVLYGRIVDAAVSIMGSQFGTMQALCPVGDPSGHGGQLRLLASRGLAAEAVGFWQWVSPAARSSCTLALKSGRRAVVPDFERWGAIAGTEDLFAFRRAGIRSAQTTPLVSRGGNLLGMISTHWSEPHDPTERDLRLMDIIARQAADLLERTIAEEDLRAREDLQRTLTSELSHRVKNMLATVQAIAAQTLRHSRDPGDFVAGFGGRIQSMSRVHSQLSANEWREMALSEVVEHQLRLGPADETRVTASGPNVRLKAAAVPQVAMMVHELGTNSIKYGALSRPEGRVTIDWAVGGDTLRLRWVERGGPPVTAPIRRGFGTRLIERSAAGAGGRAQMSLEAEGARWEITLRLPEQGPEADGSPAGSARRSKPRMRVVDLPAVVPPKSLAGKRFLVVEDEPLIAMEIAAQLEDAGAEVAGPVGDVAAALDLVERERLDASLLDANLAGAAVDEIAAALIRKGVAFAFVSGYGRDALPERHIGAEVLSKPFSAEQLLDLAVGLSRTRPGRGPRADAPRSGHPGKVRVG